MLLHRNAGIGGAKMVKNRGPEAFQQQSGSEQGSEEKKDPKHQKKPPLFGTHFECFLDLIFRLFLEPPFFVFFWENRSPK